MDFLKINDEEGEAKKDFQRNQKNKESKEGLFGNLCCSNEPFQEKKARKKTNKIKRKRRREAELIKIKRRKEIEKS